jgi:hypothetical protein
MQSRLQNTNRVNSISKQPKNKIRIGNFDKRIPGREIKMGGKANLWNFLRL